MLDREVNIDVDSFMVLASRNKSFNYPFSKFRVIVSHGLKMTFLSRRRTNWEISVPFKVHCKTIRKFSLDLAAHAFYLLNIEDGDYLMNGKATFKGFKVL